MGLTSAAGQAVIPIPVVGAFIGSLAGKIVASALKRSMGAAEADLLARLAAYEEWALSHLDDECRALLARLDQHFDNLDALARVAFDEGVNTALRLDASIRMATALGVPDHQILRSTSDLDAFMME